MLVPPAVSEELKQTDSISLYILDFLKIHQKWIKESPLFRNQFAEITTLIKKRHSQQLIRERLRSNETAVHNAV